MAVSISPVRIILLSLMILWLENEFLVSSSSTNCPQMCACTENLAAVGEDGSPTLNVACENGGLDNKRLAMILGELPETVKSIRITAPQNNPNKFSISENIAKFYDLEELHLVNCGLHSLSHGIFAQNKRLKILNVAFNKIEELTPDTFEGMEQLEILDLSGNDLWTNYMATGTFAYLKNLRALNLSDNNIQHFISNLFGDLKRLTDLVIDHNFPSIPDLDILDQLPSLEYLSMSNCNFSYLPASTFAKNKRLKRLNLSNNDLRSIETAALKNVLQLEELDLSHNGITLIFDYALSMFPNLRRLNLAGNRLGLGMGSNNNEQNLGFSPKSFSRTNLTRLDLSDNQLTEFNADNLGDARQTIQLLILSGNKLEKLTADQTRGLISLNELHISGISWSRPPNQWPPEFQRLRMLNMSRNFFDGSMFDALQKLPRLEILDMSSCNLARPLPQPFLQFVTKQLRSFYIHDNPWHCDCRLLELRDYLNKAKLTNSCHGLRYARIQCFTPMYLRGQPVTIAKLHGCEIDNNSSDLRLSAAPTSFTGNSEVSILIAGVCIAVFVVVALIVAVACCQMRPQATYRTHEDKVNLSAGSLGGGGNGGVGGGGGMAINIENDETITVNTTEPMGGGGGMERLF